MGLPSTSVVPILALFGRGQAADDLTVAYLGATCFRLNLMRRILEKLIGIAMRANRTVRVLSVSQNVQAEDFTENPDHVWDMGIAGATLTVCPILCLIVHIHRHPLPEPLPNQIGTAGLIAKRNRTLYERLFRAAPEIHNVRLHCPLLPGLANPNLQGKVFLCQRSSGVVSTVVFLCMLCICVCLRTSGV